MAAAALLLVGAGGETVRWELGREQRGGRKRVEGWREEAKEGSREHGRLRR